MIDLPETIKYPENFSRSPSAGFDGVFDWSFTTGCFGNTKITPMDIDGIVERNGRFLVFETKDPGVPVPKGQMILFKNLYSLGVFTIYFVQGKSSPERVMPWHQPGFRDGRMHEDYYEILPEVFRLVISDWFNFANGKGRSNG